MKCEQVSMMLRYSRGKRKRVMKVVIRRICSHELTLPPAVIIIGFDLYY